MKVGFIWEKGQFEQMMNVCGKTGVRMEKYNLVTEESPVCTS
jgi:hypothetical protein